jgi:GNAT superfamily N-acetyltransferase
MKAITPGEDSFERTLRFLRRTAELTADEIRPIHAGFVARSPSLPQVWTANHVHLTRPVTFEELVALADEHQADLPYRHAALDDDGTGRRLEPWLRAAGWNLEREMLMELVRPADRSVDTSMVIEADEDEMLALMERWHLEGPSEIDETGLRQLAVYGGREHRACGDRTFAIAGEDGRLAAMTKLRTGDALAQLEDVFTAPEARGRGYGRALVAHAAAVAREGGHELIFIMADDNDWPKQLCGQVGFRPIGWTWSLHREAATGARS